MSQTNTQYVIVRFIRVLKSRLLNVESRIVRAAQSTGGNWVRGKCSHAGGYSWTEPGCANSPVAGLPNLDPPIMARRRLLYTFRLCETFVKKRLNELFEDKRSVCSGKFSYQTLLFCDCPFLFVGTYFVYLKGLILYVWLGI